MDSGKEKGYVLYDEVNELLTDEFATGGRELDDLLSDLDTAGVEILEEPKVEFDKKLEEGEEPSDLELVQDFSDKTNDPVRMYLREMGTVPLLTREGEIELAKRIERGQAAVRKSLSRSALVIREILGLSEIIQRDPSTVRDILVMPDLVVTDESVAEQAEELLRTLTEIEKHYKKAQQFRQKLQAISRGMKPKMHRSLRWNLARTMVLTSRLIRGIPFGSASRRSLAGRLRQAVDELRPLEKRSRAFKGSWKRRRPTGLPAARRLCARNSGRTASASSITKKNPAPARPSCGARCKSWNAASRKPKSPRNS